MQASVPSPTPFPPSWPPVPDRAEDLKIPWPLLVELALRHIRLQGVAGLASLSRSMRVSVPVVEAVFHYLRQQQLLDVEGMRGNDYAFRLTARGREVAAQRAGQYAGPVPVSIDEYEQVTKAQAARLQVTRDTLRDVFAELVVPDDLLDQVGPALIAQKSIFVYGPTGNGKSSIAERLVRAYQDSIAVPYAVEADGHIVMVFDPVLHERLPMVDDTLDPRWVPCRRPCIISGGELAASMLELRRDEASGVYAAPLQMKANNGIFVIDDFGRQLLSPRELLNRWIVPLDRRVDYLTLAHGIKFRIPFEVLVVFSTNLDPHDLADDAFLRRIHNKVYVGGVTDGAFQQIFDREAGRRNVPCDPGVGAFMRQTCREHGPLRACLPHDLLDIIESIANYEGRPVHVTCADVERACALYFTREGVPESDSPGI